MQPAVLADRSGVNFSKVMIWCIFSQDARSLKIVKAAYSLRHSVSAIYYIKKQKKNQELS